MKLCSYVVTHDYGFAPNPFGGVLTLATCKPAIRKSAVVGDWVMGSASAASLGVNRLLFAGEVSSVMTISEYANSTMHQQKIPTLKGEHWKSCGDNIYYRSSDGNWKQRRNRFHNEGDQEHDLSGKNVIECIRFWYFGRLAPEIPAHLMSVVKRGPGHKNNERNPDVPAFLQWVQSYPEGRHGEPLGLVA